MRKLLLLSTLFLAVNALASAQERAKPELFVGYSYENIESGIESDDLRATGITRTSLDERFKLNGFNISATGYITKRFGITGDFSAGFNSRTDNFDAIQVKSKLTLYNITVGPQVKFFSERKAAPFVHALLGVSRRKLKETATDPAAAGLAEATDSTTNFAMNLGGGLDVRLNERLDLRLIQVDYNPVFLKARTIEGVNFSSRTLNGVRVSVGLVIR